MRTGPTIGEPGSAAGSHAAYRGRFAPSPTGPLHLGSLCAALASFLDARRAGGAWLVRIDDLDPPRTVPGAAQSQLASLAAHGLQPDEPVVWQRHGANHHRAALQALQAQGMLFACSCPRRLLAATDYVHRGCVVPPDPDDAAIRLAMPDRVLTINDRFVGAVKVDLRAAVGDIVLHRRDGPIGYHLACVVDDAAMGITDIVRGADLLAATAPQRVLQELLGFDAPRYGHIPVAKDAGGAKLSKSSGANALDDDDACITLLQGWALLGQNPDRIQHCTSVAALLEAAIASYDPTNIPGTCGAADLLQGPQLVIKENV